MKIKTAFAKAFFKIKAKTTQTNCLLPPSKQFFFKFDELFVSTNQVGGVIKEGREPSETIHVICLHYYLR